MLIKSTEKPLNKNGKGTITKDYVEINGLKQGLIIESLNEDKPLLLFLHGGPGFPIYPFMKAHDTRLEQFFDVCYWDQRGTGMSFGDKATRNHLTAEQLIEDTIAVVEYLRKKYTKDKVFLLGHSWGTMLGSLVASKRPDLFHAYIGIGQMGSPKESERETYDFLLKTAIDKSDHRAQQQIEKVIFDDKYYENRSYGEVKSKYTNKYGAGFIRSGYSNVETLKDILTCGTYTLSERLNILPGSFNSYERLRHFIHTTDLTEKVPTLQIPVFILHGLHDYQTTYSQAQRFYETLEAPHKKMYSFHHSAHTPFIDEENLFYKIIQDDILKNKNIYLISYKRC